MSGCFELTCSILRTSLIYRTIAVKPIYFQYGPQCILASLGVEWKLVFVYITFFF